MLNMTELATIIPAQNELESLPGNDPYDYGLRIENGDLIFEYNDDGFRDLALVSGVDNLVQGLLIMVGTPLGSDIFNVLFGFDIHSILRGGYSLAMTQQLIRLHVVRAISNDDRILRIEELVFDDESRYAELNPGADLAEARRIHKVNRRWRLDGVLQTAQGDPLVLPVEITGV